MAPSGGERVPSLPEAKKFYFSALEGNADALRRSLALLEPLVSQSKPDPLALAYFGSGRLLESAHTFAVWKKGRLAKEGLELLDRAVNAAPSNLEIRFLRAATTYHLPFWFKRREQSQSDFNQIAKRAEFAAQSGELDAPLAAAALFYHGVFASDRNEHMQAREAWRAAVRIAPASRAGRDAAGKLQSLDR